MDINNLVDALNRRAELKTIDNRTRELLILASHTIETMAIRQKDLISQLSNLSRELGYLEGRLYHGK